MEKLSDQPLGVQVEPRQCEISPTRLIAGTGIVGFFHSQPIRLLELVVFPLTTIFCLRSVKASWGIMTDRPRGIPFAPAMLSRCPRAASAERCVGESPSAG